MTTQLQQPQVKFWVSSQQILTFPNRSITEAELAPTDFQVSTWVRLMQPLSPYSFEEALLLCQESADQWRAWIPNYGEAVLSTSQFCHLS
jgi:hypothetical protein